MQWFFKKGFEEGSDFLTLYLLKLVVTLLLRVLFRFCILNRDAVKVDVWYFESYDYTISRRKSVFFIGLGDEAILIKDWGRIHHVTKFEDILNPCAESMSGKN